MRRGYVQGRTTTLPNGSIRTGYAIFDEVAGTSLTSISLVRKDNSANGSTISCSTIGSRRWPPWNGEDSGSELGVRIWLVLADGECRCGQT